MVGRSRETLIKDKKCSRTQVELTADVSSKEVKVVHRGAHPSRVGGTLLTTGEEKLLGQSGVIELVPDGDKFVVFFTEVEGDETDEKEDGPPPAKRSKMEAGDDTDPVRVRSKGMKHIQTTLTQLQSGSGQSGASVKSGASHMTGSWKWVDSVMVYTFKVASEGSGSNKPVTGKAAIFDLDYTLIGTNSGKKFAKDAEDWKWLFPCVPSKLRDLHRKDGYQIVIVSNQMGLKGKPAKESQFKTKCEAILRVLSVPVVVVVATDKDKYRKPLLGMWELLTSRLGLTVSPEACFYVGDAAGRLDGWSAGKKKDFSCSDRRFAANLGITFHTPEEFFLALSPAPFSWGNFDPRELLRSPPPLLDPKSAQIVQSSNRTEVVVFVGCPASGKSSFYQHHMTKSHDIVNRDHLGTWQKCVDACGSSVKRGRSVVIDNTNPDVESRKRYLDTAKELRVPGRCFLFTASHSHALHNNRFRELTNKNPKYKPVPELAFNTFKSKFTEPTLAEGFTDIIKVQFVPQFSSDADKKLYSMFLTEK